VIAQFGDERARLKVAVSEMPVAQIWNLPYRGFGIRTTRKLLRRLKLVRPAECNSAIRQIENLRYG